ncbi:hypothetical protein [Peribacillus acanthi]|uniref:hypothetical protein n=1 Tax=Peribacillus acanthi TaxID=2171554 RepID=UPI000D3E17AE|nr:hypothetical protein [Peribacillus acanthi]
MVSSFYLIKPRITKTDIFYKVYITETHFYFIKVGGQFHNRYAYNKQLPDLFEILFLFWFKRLEKKQENLELKIDQKVSQNEVAELLQERHNFSLNIGDIKEITINKAGTFHTGFNDNGTITFELLQEEKLKFIIPKTTLRMTVKRCIELEGRAFAIREL